PVGLLRPRIRQLLLVIGGACEDSTPVRLVWWRRRERCVRADRGEEDEHRLASARRNLEGIHSSDGELIGDVPPAKGRTLIVETGKIIDLVKSVECTLGPRRSRAWHDGDRPVAMTRERTHHGLASWLGHQPHTGLLVAHLGT